MERRIAPVILLIVGLLMIVYGAYTVYSSRKSKMVDVVEQTSYPQAAAGTALLLAVVGGRFHFGSMAEWFRTWDLAALTPRQIRTVAEYMEAARVPRHILQAVQDTGETMGYDNTAVVAYAVREQRKRV
jgi:hypothetical protein